MPAPQHTWQGHSDSPAQFRSAIEHVAFNWCVESETFVLSNIYSLHSRFLLWLLKQAVHHDVYAWLHAPKIQAAGKINMDEEAIVPSGLVPVFWRNGVQHLKNSLHRRDQPWTTPWTSYRSYMQKLVELCDVIWCHVLLKFLYSWSLEAFPHSGGTFQAPAEQWQNKASLPPFWWRWHCGLWTWLFLEKNNWPFQYLPTSPTLQSLSSLLQCPCCWRSIRSQMWLQHLLQQVWLPKILKLPSSTVQLWHAFESHLLPNNTTQPSFKICQQMSWANLRKSSRTGLPQQVTLNSWSRISRGASWKIPPSSCFEWQV